MENLTLPTNWLAALSNARSASRWVTLVQQEPRRHSNHLGFLESGASHAELYD